MNKKLMVLCMSSMILGGCIPSPKKQTEAITVEENPNMMYMLVGSYATPEEEGIKVYNFDEQNGNSQYISGIKGISNPSFLIPSADGERIYAVGEDSGKSSTANAIKFDKEQKKLTLLNSQPTDGVAVSQGNIYDAYLRAAYIEELAQLYYNALCAGQGEEPYFFPPEELQKWEYPSQIKFPNK